MLKKLLSFQQVQNKRFNIQNLYASSGCSKNLKKENKRNAWYLPIYDFLFQKSERQLNESRK